MLNRINRRDLLVASATTTVATMLPLQTPKPNRTLRFAHITDIHVQPNGAAPKGMENALAAIQSLKDKPEFIITGGDQIMDAFGAEEQRVKDQWQVWQSVMKANLELPIAHVVGNHDIWGWSQEKSKTTGKEPLFGKNWPKQELQLDQTYYAFNRAGWKWIILDSTQPLDGGYVAKLDDEQFEWLTSELNSTPKETPILIVSHQPLLCAAAYLDGDNEKSGNWQVPGAWMHIDFRKIKDLFHKHPNVKLALSGHIHLVDRIDYLGITYLCNGAVSGGWWGGPYQEFENGYAIIDLYEDGTFQHQFQTYSWK